MRPRVAEKKALAEANLPALDRGSREYDARLDPDVVVIPNCPGGDTYYIKHRQRWLGSLCWRLRRRPHLRVPGKERCTREAGWGTNHVGTGACRFHGGNSGRGGALPTVRPDYGDYLQDKFAARFRAFVEMDQPKSLLNELALLRVLLTTLVQKPVWNTKEVRDTLEAVGRMVDRMERLDMSMSLTQAQVQLLVVHMVALIKQHIMDVDRRVAFAKEFLELFGIEPDEQGMLRPGSVNDGRVLELAQVKYGMALTP